MKRNIQFVILALIAITMLFSCEKYKLGACEYYKPQEGGYFCTSLYYDDETGCEGWGGGVGGIYHETSSCYDLGYTKKDEYITYISPSGASTPGKNGYYSSNPGSGGSGGGGGGSCSSSYNGPSTSTYPQTAPFCYQAWYYRCSSGLSLSSQQVSVNCSTYDIWRQNNPNLPECQYCK